MEQVLPFAWCYPTFRNVINKQTMQGPDIETVPTFYKAYISHVLALELIDALKVSSEQSIQFIRAMPETKGEFRYQSDKWSVKELLCHTMDAERIFAYRALRFARNDKTDLHGFEENDYAPEANAHGRTLAQLADEMIRLRISTIDLFSSFTPAMLQRTGTANGNKLSVLNLGYIIAGHEIHHRTVLQERYLK
jgi:uncharacterized damage-inducible protein DinB